jgi:hypothetical protein
MDDAPEPRAGRIDVKTEEVEDRDDDGDERRGRWVDGARAAPLQLHGLRRA